jgi:hypothetical protein
MVGVAEILQATLRTPFKQLLESESVIITTRAEYFRCNGQSIRVNGFGNGTELVG